MVEGIFLNASHCVTKYTSLPVLFNLFPIYKHKPKYNLLVIVLPWGDTFAAFVLFRLKSLFTILSGGVAFVYNVFVWSL